MKTLKAQDAEKSQGLVNEVLEEVARISQNENFEHDPKPAVQKSETEIFLEELKDLGLNEKITWGGTVYTKVFGPIAL